MHADTDAEGCPQEQLLCTGVLLGVMELMRARGLLGDWPAAPASRADSVPGTGPAVPSGYAVSATAVPATRSTGRD